MLFAPLARTLMFISTMEKKRSTFGTNIVLTPCVTALSYDVQECLSSENTYMKIVLTTTIAIENTRLQKSLLKLVYTIFLIAGRGTGDPQTLDDFNPFASFGGCFYSQFQ
ncbi:hypothetical protein CAEBREN_16337 [Caenorhabditis brenneri]|uniref:Uncharacterized protein n=1 Tax=Caenorhabditis brenneri TaxID=135651 RepID=G0MXU4_CAEBE|nr:hypothetical protein CAEBREN_16337 [Caenorhabditis brenneri]